VLTKRATVNPRLGERRGRGWYLPDELVCNLLLFGFISFCFLVFLIVFFQLRLATVSNGGRTSSWSCLMFSPMYFPWEDIVLGWRGRSKDDTGLLIVAIGLLLRQLDSQDATVISGR
jgi:hypothetical protein